MGILLHGATGADPEVAERLAVLVAEGGRLRLLLSAAPGDARRGVAQIQPAHVVATFERLGMVPVEVRLANVTDPHAARSSWGRRLLSGQNGARRAWLFELARER